MTTATCSFKDPWATCTTRLVRPCFGWGGVSAPLSLRADSDGNQLAIQGNGDLYIERTGSDGRLAGAYYAGNIQDVPMSDPRELAARVDRILDDGQE